MTWMEAELMPKEVLDWHSPCFLCLYSHPPSNTHTHTHTLYPYTEHMCFYSFGSVMGSGWHHTFMYKSINCICLWDKGQIVLHTPTFLPGRQGIYKGVCVCVYRSKLRLGAREVHEARPPLPARTRAPEQTKLRFVFLPLLFFYWGC